MAAKSGTLSTAKAVEQSTNEIRASDRAQVEAIQGLTSNEPPGGLSCQNLSLSHAEDLVTAELDQEVEVKKSKAPADQNAQFLGLLSSLVTRIEQLDDKMARQDNEHTTILRELRSEIKGKATDRVPKGILHPPSKRTEESAVSSVARRHAASTPTRTTTNQTKQAMRDTMDAGRRTKSVALDNDNDSGSDEGGWSDNEAWEQTRNKKSSHRTGYWSDSSNDGKRRVKTKGKKTKSPPHRMYAIARGRGGAIATGLYIDQWDNLEFLVSGYSKSRYKKVRSEKEGVSFIRSFLKSKGMDKPKWMRGGEAHYPNLSKIRRVLGMDVDSSDESDISFSDSDSSLEGKPPSKPKTTSKEEIKKIGVDSSLGKDNELFGLGIKNVNTLEKGLAPHGLGKHSISLFLEQIDDMTAYPRHVSHKNSEALGDFVEAVTDLSYHKEGRRAGGTKDTGWKSKQRNALEAIKGAEGLNNALNYLHEEHHTILETCQGDLESVLVNAHVEEDAATTIASNSLALRIA